MVNARDKGNRFERDQGKWLLKNDDSCPVLGSLTSSCARVGHITELGIDLLSLHYVGEAKNRESAPKWLIGAWEQIIQRSKELNEYNKLDKLGAPKSAFLAITKNRMSVMHVIQPERHAELLAKEKKLDILTAGEDAQ